MKLWVLMYIVSVSLVAAKSPPIDVPPTAEETVAPVPAAGGKGALKSKGHVCGGDENFLCDYDYECTLSHVDTCHEMQTKPNEGELNGRCKNDKDCNEGLSCAIEKVQAGLNGYTCVKTPGQGDLCAELGRKIPCAKGYKCLVKGSNAEGNSYCTAEGYNPISGQFEPCDEDSKAECGPGLSCIKDEKKGSICMRIPLKYADDNKLPKEGEKCSGEYGKEGVCATGLVCVSLETDVDKEKGQKRDGICQHLGLQGEQCEVVNEFKTPCAVGYNCVSRGPLLSPSVKYCMKKDHKFMVYRSFDGCGPETQNICAPELECVESKTKYPGVKICMKKGENEDTVKTVMAPADVKVIENPKATEYLDAYVPETISDTVL